MKRISFLVIVIAFSLFSSGDSFAQGWSGETELGLDGKGHSFASQYIFYDFKSSNILTRYFWVNGVLQRGEFSIGPTFKLGKSENVLKFQFGGTTDKEIQAAGTFFAKVWRHEILYIADGKISVVGNTSTLYQKVFFSLNHGGTVQFRMEDLQVGQEQGFLRIGIELRKNLPGKSHIFVAPFYDPLKPGFGGQFGFRFF